MPEHGDGIDEPADVLGRFDERMPQLSAAEARIAQAILENTQQAVLLSSAQLAALAGTSDTTVVRMSRSLGFSGWAELKRALGSQLAQSTHPSQRLATRLGVTRDATPSEFVQTIFAEAGERLAITTGDLDAEAFERATAILDEAETIMAYGVGVSRLCAEYLGVSLSRIGRRTRVATAMGFAFADDLMQLREGDVLVVFAPGRTFAELDAAFAQARSAGARTVLVTGRYRHDYDAVADCVLHVAGSPGGLTGDLLTASVAVDALTLALASASPARATASSRQLNQLRRALTKPRRTTADPRPNAETEEGPRR